MYQEIMKRHDNDDDASCGYVTSKDLFDCLQPSAVGFEGSYSRQRP